MILMWCTLIHTNSPYTTHSFFAVLVDSQVGFSPRLPVDQAVALRGECRRQAARVRRQPVHSSQRRVVLLPPLPHPFQPEPLHSSEYSREAGKETHSLVYRLLPTHRGAAVGRSCVVGHRRSVLLRALLALDDLDGVLVDVDCRGMRKEAVT